MALRTILTVEDGNEEALRKHSRPVTSFNARIHGMLDDMAETLKAAGGVGLAAPQVGILRRMVVIEQEDGSILELVNPEIIETEGEQTDLEGCLSFPGLWGEVTRPMTVTVRAMDRDGNPFTATASGLIGRCFVHECEHLDGILFVDRTDHILTEEELEEMEEKNRLEEEAALQAQAEAADAQQAQPEAADESLAQPEEPEGSQAQPEESEPQAQPEQGEAEEA